MVYHEVRNVDGKKANYLISNKRKNGKWTKKSKFLGYGEITKKKIEELKENFEIEIISEKKEAHLYENLQRN